MIYKSPNTGEHVSAHQYIAELVVNRKAARYKEILPQKYWNIKDSKWAKEYKQQVAACGKILRKYSPSAVINALNNLEWCYSLTNKTLSDEIKSEQIKIDKINSSTPKKIEIIESTEVRNNFKKNKLDKFR